MLLLADQLAVHSHSAILCTILLIAAIVLIVVGVAEALGWVSVSRSRFGALVGGIVLLVVYFLAC